MDNPETMNPLDESLVGKTKFKVRGVIEFDVEVPDEPVEFNGQRTNLGRAEHFVRFYLRNAIFQKYSTAIKYSRDDDAKTFLHDEELINNPNRLFTRSLFMGRGDYSMREHDTLLGRVESALSHLSGLQQGGDDPEKAGEKYIETVVRDVAMALIGKEIKFIE